MIQGLYFGMDVADLTTMMAEARATRKAILEAHQSYSLAGRTFNRAPLEAVTRDIFEIQAALNRASGSLVRTVYIDQSNA